MATKVRVNLANRLALALLALRGLGPSRRIARNPTKAAEQFGACVPDGEKNGN